MQTSSLGENFQICGYVFFLNINSSILVSTSPFALNVFKAKQRSLFVE